MPDLRTNRTVAQRLELQLDRYPNPLHRHRRWCTLAGGLLPLLFVGYFAARHDHTIFLSQPVAESHGYFQADCQTCHRRAWQPLIRLASTDPSATSVQDQACHACHEQRKDDHHALAMAKGVPDCTACHREHRGAVPLTDQADASCVKCHEPFADHPQFALLRPWPLDRQQDASGEARMKLLGRVAKLLPADDSTMPPRGTWTDKTALKFSHEGHLVPLAPRWTGGTNETTSAALTVQLTCADCHQMDANGQYMQPIVYERHCRECHPLRFSSRLDVDGLPAGDDSGHGLPHESPEIVRGAIRERLINYARRYPDEVLGPASRLPNRPSVRGPTPEQEWEWVDSELQHLEEAIFRAPRRDGTAHPSNACLKCHEPAAAAARAAPGFAIEPPGIPARWLPHSHFRHDRHLNMQCTDCHHTASGPAAADASIDRRLGSTKVQDILMPPWETCQACHGATSGSQAAFRPARKNCTECHHYHHVRRTKADHEPAPQ